MVTLSKVLLISNQVTFLEVGGSNLTPHPYSSDHLYIETIVNIKKISKAFIL